MENSTSIAAPGAAQPKIKGKKGKPVKKPRSRKAKLLRMVVVLLVLAVLAAAVVWFLRQQASAVDDSAAVSYETLPAETGSLTTSLSGSGTLEPANSYTVTTLVEGEVLSADFEEGDNVTTDTVLYTIDSSNATTAMEKAQLSLEQAQNNYNNAIENLDKLKVATDTAGTVTELDVEVGDDVTAGQTIAVIQNSSVMTLKVDFLSDDAESFTVGQTATVTLDGSLETLSGTVSKISAVDTVLSTNQIVRQVTIDVKNPGAISTSQYATAEVTGDASVDSGTFSYKGEKIVTAKVAGTISAIRVSEGSSVSEDQILAILTSDALDDAVDSAYQSLRNSQLSLDNENDTLESYTITSPIEGTIIDKYCKAGDKASSGETMCLIYDLSYLTLSLNIDELDISQVQVGQTATITADAAEGASYEGIVTKVSVAGTTSGGVTTYPVTIRVDSTDGLLPGMNVDAEIVTDSASDVIVISAQAVERGNRVLITSDSPSAVNALQGQPSPDGYVYVEVTTGLSDDNNVAILTGLQEGDTVAYAVAATESAGTESGGIFGGGLFGGNSGGSGGMPSGGGGMPAGGGEMPSGGGPSGGPSGGGGMPGGN